MENFNEIEATLLSHQIGCMLRWERLTQKLSQFDLATNLGTYPTLISRIERSANLSSWDKIYLVAKELNVMFSSLFVLKKKEALLQIIEESILMEQKLTTPKKKFYENLRHEVSKLYEMLDAY